MKKQSGFTLIELMVVMAIIAILAIAGLAAYVGYIKQARDTARIADLSVINKALLAEITNKGSSPTDMYDTDPDVATVVAAIKAVNNGALLRDPTGGANCLDKDGDATESCVYRYRQCDNGSGFVVSTRFESKTNLNRYASDGIESILAFESGAASDADSNWSLGACTALCSSVTTTCVLIGDTEIKEV